MLAPWQLEEEPAVPHPFRVLCEMGGIAQMQKERIHAVAILAI
jgi:hypothetical protein